MLNMAFIKDSFGISEKVTVTKYNKCKEWPYNTHSALWRLLTEANEAWDCVFRSPCADPVPSVKYKGLKKVQELYTGS